MAKKSLVLIGGVLMMISVFLPVLFFSMSASGWGISVSVSIYYWMFGFAYAIATASAGGATASASASHFEADPLGITCMIIILVGAILAFALAKSESKGAMIGGLLGLLGMIVYIIGVYGGFGVPAWVSMAAGMLVPFIGFYVCIIGGILALVGGLL